MMMKKYLSLLLSLLSFSIYTPLLAQEVSDATTHHKILINGKTYPYTTKAGTLTLHNKHGKPTVRIFYTAYTVDNVPLGKRPVTFFYNGGPGASTMLLRIGSFGPKRIMLNGVNAVPPPPYRLINNESSLLDKTDLVFIDMPGTGFGRLMGESQPADFYSVDKDAETFAEFIERYISINHRWNSPKFLFGESYGCIRSSVLVNYLQKVAGVQINGVILLSSKLNRALMGDRIAGGDWQYILYLPSLAATSWYFHASSYHPESLQTLLKEVKHFAMTEYLDALADGSTISKEKFNTMVEKLHRYLGLSSQYIRNMNLRVSYDQFQSQLLRNKGKWIGRFDSRFTSYRLDKGKDTLESDPVNTAIKSAFIAANNKYLRADLHYDTPLVYRTSAVKPADWDFKHGDQFMVNAATDLAEAMTQNPHLQVFSASGYYDFATPFYATVYTLQHLNLNPALQHHIRFHFYQSGHMVYLDTDTLKKFKQDLADWYDATLSQNNRT